MGAWSAVAGFVSGRRSSWVALLLGVLLGGSLIAVGGSALISNAPTAGLSPSAESVQVAAIQRTLPSGQVGPAVIVYARADHSLSGADRAAINGQRASLAKIALGGRVSPPVYSRDGRAAIVTVPLDARALHKSPSRWSRRSAPPSLTACLLG